MLTRFQFRILLLVAPRMGSPPPVFIFTTVLWLPRESWTVLYSQAGVFWKAGPFSTSSPRTGTMLVVSGHLPVEPFSRQHHCVRLRGTAELAAVTCRSDSVTPSLPYRGCSSVRVHAHMYFTDCRILGTTYYLTCSERLWLAPFLQKFNMRVKKEVWLFHLMARCRCPKSKNLLKVLKGQKCKTSCAAASLLYCIYYITASKPWRMHDFVCVVFFPSFLPHDYIPEV